MNKKLVLSIAIVLFLSALVLVGAGCGKNNASESLYREYCRLHKDYMEKTGGVFEANSIDDCVDKAVKTIEEGRKECLKEESHEECEERIEMIDSMFQGMIDEYKRQGLK